jgi:hypothetical protein
VAAAPFSRANSLPSVATEQPLSGLCLAEARDPETSAAMLAVTRIHIGIDREGDGGFVR